MHAPIGSADFAELSHDAMLHFDRALRRARERVLNAGPLSGPQWAVMVELAADDDGMALESLEAGAIKHFGRPMLLACLSNLQEAKLVDGLKHEHAPLLSHVRITRQGHAAIQEILEGAVAILKRQAR
jgi:hypothetical protein